MPVPALPDPHPQVIGAEARCATWTLVRCGKSGWCSCAGPEGGEVDRLGILDEEGAVRVAHARRHRIAVDRQVQRVDLARQRNVAPVEQRRAHVDAGQPAARILARREPALGPDRQPVAARSASITQPRDAAGGVAAGGRRACRRRCRRSAASRRRRPRAITASWSKPTPRCRSPSARASAAVIDAGAVRGVDHDEVVAEPVHLHEGQAGFALILHGARV